MPVSASEPLASSMPECGNLRFWLRTLANEKIITINDPSILQEDSVMRPIRTTSMRSGNEKVAEADHFELVDFGGAERRSKSAERQSKNAKASGQTQVISASSPEFPPGIRSVQEWGNTRCVMPKVKSLKMSYADLMQSDDPDIATYLKWVMENATGRSGKIDDLANYLKASGYVIPGTKETRVFKS